MNVMRREPRSFLIAAVGLSTSTWNVAFNLGAYQTIFFRHLFATWLIVTVILLATFAIPARESPISWQGRLLLLVPNLTIITDFITHTGVVTGELPDFINTTLGTIVILLCLPYAVYVAVNVINPDVFHLRRFRFQIALAAILVTVFVSGFLFGANNHLFLTCGDFRISGEAEPANCLKGPPSQFTRFW